MHKTRSARRANEQRRNDAAAKQAVLPMNDIHDEHGRVIVKGQKTRAAERMTAHRSAYPSAPTYR